ncbi:MAG: hypothetical protein GY756_22530 [bacterium]|nr:hypothetical protein [bacterium]
MLLFKPSLISVILILLSFCINSGCKILLDQDKNRQPAIKHITSTKPKKTFAYLGPIIINAKKYSPGDELKLSIPFMAIGLKAKQQLKINISVSITGLKKQSKIITTRQQNNEVFFKYILPKNIIIGYKILKVELSSKYNLDTYTDKIFIYKPKIHINKVLAKPDKIKPGELITLYGYYQSQDLNPNTKAKVYTSFSGKYIDTVKKENIIENNSKKIHTVVYHFPKNSEEGIYSYRFILKSDYGSSYKTGTFAVEKNE